MMFSIKALTSDVVKRQENRRTRMLQEIMRDLRSDNSRISRIIVVMPTKQIAIQTWQNFYDMLCSNGSMCKIENSYGDNSLTTTFDTKLIRWVDVSSIKFNSAMQVIGMGHYTHHIDPASIEMLYGQQLDLLTKYDNVPAPSGFGQTQHAPHDLLSAITEI